MWFDRSLNDWAPTVITIKFYLISLPGDVGVMLPLQIEVKRCVCLQSWRPRYSLTRLRWRSSRERTLVEAWRRFDRRANQCNRTLYFSPCCFTFHRPRTGGVFSRPHGRGTNWALYHWHHTQIHKGLQQLWPRLQPSDRYSTHPSTQICLNIFGNNVMIVTILFFLNCCTIIWSDFLGS